MYGQTRSTRVKPRTWLVTRKKAHCALDTFQPPNLFHGQLLPMRTAPLSLAKSSRNSTPKTPTSDNQTRSLHTAVSANAPLIPGSSCVISSAMTPYATMTVHGLNGATVSVYQLSSVQNPARHLTRTN